MMKKIIALFVALFLAVMPMLSLAEAENVIALNGVDMAFVPVADATLLTRESEADLFTQVGLDKQSMGLYMSIYGVYALMIDNAGETEYQISALLTNDGDLAALTAQEQAQRCETLRAQYAGQSYEVLSAEIMQSANGALWVRVEASYTYSNGEVAYSVDYFTWYEGYVVTVSVFPYKGETTESQLALGSALMESVQLTVQP